MAVTTHAYKPYQAYKDSGVEWLREIPAHWDLKRVRHLFRWQRGRIPDRIPVVSGHDSIPYLSMAYLRGQEAPHCMIPTARDIVAKAGQVILLWDGSNAGEFLRAKHGLVSSTSAVMQPFIDSESRFWFYACKWVEPVLKDLTVGMGIPHVDARYLADLVCPVPSPAERKAIASLLDRETARIEELVAKNERLLELLQEKRTAQITRAVTKGLDPNAAMKDSGVEWLGSIPAHWNVRKLKHVCERIFVGIAEAATFAYVDDGVPMLRSTDVRANRVRTDDIRRIDRRFAARLLTKQLRTGDIVTVRTGNAGVSAVVPADYDGGQCFTLVVSRPAKGHDSQYYCFWLNSPAGQQQFAIEGMGTAQVNISVPIVQNAVVCVPPPQEQEAVAECVRDEFLRSEALIAKIQEAIDRLTELRNALIAAAVTGKIDVREEVA